MVAPALDVRYIVGGAGLVTQGLALAWGEQRFAERSEDPVDTALAELVPRWIWRAYHTAIDAAPTWAQRVRLKLGPMGKQIARFLDLNLAYSPFPWEELASAFGMSRRNVLRKVLESLGVPPGDLLAGMRLDRARELLLEPTRSLADIALACGYSSQSHFSTVFKAEHGLSPLHFRTSLSPGRKNLSPGR